MSLPQHNNRSATEITAAVEDWKRRMKAIGHDVTAGEEDVMRRKMQKTTNEQAKRRDRNRRKGKMGSRGARRGYVNG